MRPTEIQERSPQQRTPSMLYPLVTSKGATLTFPSPLLNPKSKSTFPRSERWEYIRDRSDRTAPQNGPGSHRYSISTNKGRGPKLLSSSFVESGQNVNDYYYSGNLLCKKVEEFSPRNSKDGFPKIHQTFRGLDKFLRSRIFLKDASGNASPRDQSKSELSRILENGSRLQPRSSSVLSRIRDRTIEPKEVEQKDLDTIDTIELSQFVKHKNHRKGSATPDRQISPLNSFRKPHIPLSILPDVHLNRSFVRTLTPLKQRIDLSPIAKDRKDYYLTAQSQTLEKAKRRIRPKVYVNGQKKNNSFAGGLFIRNPFDL